ncbi:MAG: hypothetical protein IKJ63_06955 [Clostridia bacterium]|nr:hypothetical protein [Clostridia bacterium]MBR3955193.1 hypothetical protein [Clostridia bacterium]
MKNNDWYLQRAYDILSELTPLQDDCGLLCNGKCCKGSSSDGMLLFPGEEKYFENEPSFVIKESSCGKTLICKGTCNRKTRPLACRIFPLFPYVTKAENGYRVNVLKDVRALQYCPLDGDDILPGFYRAVRLATRNLLRDEQSAQFLLNMTRSLTDLGNL